MLEARVEVLKRHKGDRSVFLETGTFRGNGVQAALDAGFTTVRSVEIDRKLGEQARARFLDDPRVVIFIKDSVDWLPAAARTWARPVVWLDAHPKMEELLGSDPCPLLTEIEALRECSPLFMVDDYDALGRDGTDFWHKKVGVVGRSPSQGEVESAIREIGHYRFFVEDTERPGKLLVAVPGPETGPLSSEASLPL